MTLTTLSRRRTRLLAVSLALCSALSLGGCGGGASSAGGQESAQSSGGSLGSAAPRSASPQSAAPAASPTPDGSGLAAASTAKPSVQAWTPPSLKFYNEDYSVWSKDDSVVDTTSVTSNGNIEGFRTYDNTCIGYETRDISSTVATGLDDRTTSEALLKSGTGSFEGYQASDPAVVNLVRDDAGTMEGLSTSYSGTFTFTDGTSQAVEGYHYARTVKEAGLAFDVLVMCQSGANLSEDQWHTILSGIRIEGLDAGALPAQ